MVTIAVRDDEAAVTIDCRPIDDRTCPLMGHDKGYRVPSAYCVGVGSDALGAPQPCIAACDNIGLLEPPRVGPTRGPRDAAPESGQARILRVRQRVAAREARGS